MSVCTGWPTLHCLHGQRILTAVAGPGVQTNYVDIQVDSPSGKFSRFSMSTRRTETETAVSAELVNAATKSDVTRCGEDLSLLLRGRNGVMEVEVAEWSLGGVGGWVGGWLW